MSEIPGDVDPSAAAILETAAASGAESSTNDLEQHRATRTRRLWISVLTLAVTRPLALLGPLIVVPLTLDYLGTEGFGLYQAIVALAVWLSMTNLGLGLGLMNELTGCHVSGDRERARRYVSSFVVALLVIFAAGVLVVSLVTPWINWQRIFATDDPHLRHQVPLTVWLASVVALLGVVVSLPQAIYSGYQEVGRAGIWEAVVRVAALGACFAVVHTSLGLPGTVLALAGVPAGIRLLNTGVLLGYEKKWLRPSFRLFDWQLLKTTISHGIWLFLLQLSVVALLQSDKLIISGVLNPAAVTGYSIVGQIFITVYGVFIMILYTMWPAHGEAIRRGDWTWVRRNLNLSLFLGVGSTSGCGAMMYFFGDWIIAHWTREPIHVSRGLILGIAAMFTLRVWVECRSVVLNSANVVMPQVGFFGAYSILNIILGILLARRFGVEGVAWATFIAGLLTVSWSYPWMVRRYLPQLSVGGARLNQGQAVRCRVCGSSDCVDCGPPLYLRPTKVAGVPIDISDLPLGHYRCKQCSYRFVHPPIPDDRLLACYQRAESQHWRTDSSVAETRSYGSKRDLLLRFASGRKVLDFGCFDGGFLDFLGPDWARYGIEPSTEAAKIASDRGIQILGPTIASLNGTETSTFDAVVNFDVMEHVAEPVAVLKSLADLLKPGGIMLIETGNSDSPHFRLVGRAYPYCRLVEHIGFFNRRSIEQAANLSGMELIHFQSSVHAKAPGAKRQYLKNWAWVSMYYILRAAHALHVPLTQRLSDIASGAVPRGLYARDHFLAVLRRR